MNMNRSTEEFNIKIGKAEKGKLNNICDVAGISVGHCTVDNELHKTGVTVILPCRDNPFVRKLPAAAVVFNGFGKTAGTIQIEELGSIETPIALTNTLNVGLVHDAVVQYMADRCTAENVEMHSINPIIAECNDCTLNKITDRAVKYEHVMAAINSASSDFLLGDVGAGKGMICHGLKGGIGSSSRLMNVGGRSYSLGVLVLTNHGRLENLTVNGYTVGRKFAQIIEGNEVDKGSCIIIMATDLPVSSRQIKRIIKRASVGLARLGSFIGNGSGELAIGFSTANRFEWNKETPFCSCEILNESLIDIPFVAMAEATEEAILRSMLSADTVTGFDGTTIRSFVSLNEELKESEKLQRNIL